LHTVYLTWATEPLHARLFALYLIAVCGVTAFRTLKLFRSFYSLTDRAHISFETIRSGTVAPDLLAVSALKGKIARDLTTKRSSRPDTSVDTSGRESFVKLLHSADSNFRYLWTRCAADVDSIKRLAFLTLCLSFFVVVYGAFPTWSDQFNSANITGITALFQTVSLLFQRLELGIATAAILYGISSCFARITTYRRAEWEYFHSRSENELATGL
jgi:hypothetical protein